MKQDTTKLEYILGSYARPTFLAISQPNEFNDIKIIISCIVFSNMQIDERIDYVFNLIKMYIPSVIMDRLIIIEAYNSTEMEEVITSFFQIENA